MAMLSVCLLLANNPIFHFKLAITVIVVNSTKGRLAAG